MGTSLIVLRGEKLYTPLSHATRREFGSSMSSGRRSKKRGSKQAKEEGEEAMGKGMNAG